MAITSVELSAEMEEFKNTPILMDLKLVMMAITSMGMVAVQLVLLKRTIHAVVEMDSDPLGAPRMSNKEYLVAWKVYSDLVEVFHYLFPLY